MGFVQVENGNLNILSLTSTLKMTRKLLTSCLTILWVIMANMLENVTFKLCGNLL